MVTAVKATSLEERVQQASRSRCQECGARLTVAWGGAYGLNEYVTRCAVDPQHVGIECPAPETFYSNSKQRREELVTLVGEDKTQELAPYINQPVISKKDAIQILRTVWPKAPEVEVAKAAIICAQYGLNPLMKHIFLIPFNEGTPKETWVTVVGIKATRLIARRQGQYSYLDGTPRLMTDIEQKERFSEVDNNMLWAYTLIKDEHGNQAPGFGCWPKEKQPHGTDKGNTKSNMAFIRSERAAFDRLFPGAIPAEVEILDENYVNGKAPAAPQVVFSHPSGDYPFDVPYLREALTKLKWRDETVKSFIKANYKLQNTDGPIPDVVARLSHDDCERFFKELNDRLGML